MVILAQFFFAPAARHNKKIFRGWQTPSIIGEFWSFFFTIAAGLYYCNLSSIFFFACGAIRIFLDFVAPGVRL